MTRFDPIDAAVEAVRRGEFVVVVDAEDRDDVGDLVVAAEAMTDEKMAWLLRHSDGVVRTPMTGDNADRLHLPPASAEETIESFTVTIDLLVDELAEDRADAAILADTVAALGDPERSPRDFTRPGRVRPQRTRPGGVLERAGSPEAAVDVCRLAGRSEVAAVAGLGNDDGTPVRLADCRAFADRWGIRMIAISDLIRYRRHREKLVDHFGEARIPTTYGEFTAHAYRSLLDGVEHVAYVMGDVDGGTPPLVRVHSECLTGDILASIRCDCGPQLHTALQRIADEGRGVLVYLRGHEGRGIGIGHKLRAYALQDGGLDTVEANEAQGLPVDSRDYGVGASILADLGITSMRLMTNNPTKLVGLEGYDLVITEQVPIEIATNPENVRYLRTKRDRMGHTLAGDESADGGSSA